MKFAQRTALVCSITASFSLAVACGSNDSSGLFSTGGIGASSGGSFANGGSSAHAGQANGGSNSNRGGSTSTSGGHANGGGNSAGTTSNGGSNQGGTGAGGDSGGTTAMGGAAIGGSAGTEAAGSGGTVAGTGGTSAGAGGMSGGGAGGAVGGSGGSSGSGGSGGLNGCPPNTPPQDGAPCMVSTPDSCYYPGEACSCLQDLQGPGKHWGCYGTPDKCPTGAAPHPTDGASCKGYSGGLCPYSATDFCACIPALGGGGEPKWGCNQSDSCPATRPQNAFCSTVRECTYGDRACFCSGTVWGCE